MKKQTKITKILKDMPFPFKIEAINKINKEDIKKAKLLEDLAVWDWNNGGKEKYLNRIKKLLTNLRYEKTN